jgi:hypothetical protein
MRTRLLLLIVCLGLALCFTAPAASQVIAPPAGAVTAAAPAPVPAVKAAPRERLGLIERRKLGLTVANVAATCKELKARGEWSEDHATNAAAVAKILAEKEPKAWAEAIEADRDWQAFFDAVLAFIEKLIALFSMFGGL